MIVIRTITIVLWAIVLITFMLSCKKKDNGTVPIIPVTPTNLGANVVSGTQINLSWTDNSTNETGFKIQRKTIVTNYEDIVNVNTDITSYSDNGLTPNTTYTYRVYAFNAAGNSLDYTNEATVTNTITSAGTIASLNCASATHYGTLTAGSAASKVSIIVPYTGANAGRYAPQTVSSTGVTGLTATLTAGTFASGAGTLTYGITGIPSASGTASFALNIGGQACTLNRTVSARSSLGSSPSCFATNNVHNPTLNYGSMTDQDGNVYKTIQIGTQTWMAENLKARRYRNGDVIPVVTNAAWSSLTTGATCWYNNDSATYNCPYGKLYNWYAVVDSRNVCPTGWHVPTDAEFTTLTNFLGGGSIAGGKMKTTGTQYWRTPNTAADNSSGWSGTPGGTRYSNGNFNNIGRDGWWWVSSAPYIDMAWYRNLSYGIDYIIRDYGVKQAGFSVRCLRD